MTTVHVSMARDDGTGTLAALPGSLYWEPTTRREDGTAVVLPVGFAMNLVAGEATKDVEPSGLTWCWRVTERVQDGTVRYVSVPDSAETVEYVDLPDVDPDTLVAWSPADPEAAYQAALDAIEVTGGVTSVDGKTGAVSLSDTYAPRNATAAITLTDASQAIDMHASPATGDVRTLVITAGGGTPSWDSLITWDAGIAPTLSAVAGERDVLTFLYTGADWLGFVSGLFAAAPAEAVPPTAGTLGVVMGVTTADLTVTGATDETALAAEPYAFTMDGGATWTAYQAGATYQYTSLVPSTSYTFQHRVIDLAGNVSTGVAVTDSTAADVTGPTAGTLAVVPTSTTATLTVSGASDDVALAAAPYAYSSDGGSTWTAYQAGDSYEFTGLTPSTSYDFRHKVKDAAGNETLGAIATTSTQATPSDTTPPTAGTLAGSGETSDGFTLTVSGAADETALDAAPYAFSTDNGSTYTAWQASNVYAATGLAASTGYTCVHKVRDAAGNVSTGSSITVTTAASSTVTYLAHAEDPSDGTQVTTRTFTDVPFGTESANRVIVVGYVSRGGTAATASGTIGGVAATVALNFMAGSNQVGFMYATVPTGTTGTVEIVIDVGVGYSSSKTAIGVWASSAAVTISDTGASLRSTTVTATAGDSILAIAMWYDGAAGTIWTGVTEAWEVLPFDTAWGVGGGSATVGTTGDVTVSSSQVTSYDSIGAIVVSPA